MAFQWSVSHACTMGGKEVALKSYLSKTKLFVLLQTNPLIVLHVSEFFLACVAAGFFLISKKQNKKNK